MRVHTGSNLTPFENTHSLKGATFQRALFNLIDLWVRQREQSTWTYCQSRLVPVLWL